MADIWGAFLRTGSVLIFVIAIMIILLFFLKKFSRSSLVRRKNELIKVVSMHHFSPREKLVLVDVMDKRLLIGVTTQTIQTLAIGKIAQVGIDKNSTDNQNYSNSNSGSNNINPNKKSQKQEGDGEDDLVDKSTFNSAKVKFPNIFNLKGGNS